ncbi:MAG: ATP-dependent DNA helicase RecG, partial [Pseudomonadota bacterium]|nr:ATP-dependent DNA helicase RecG [Pseudomonadota bacterium]
MSIPIRKLSGVGEAVAQLLAKLNIKTAADLLFHLPRDYEDRSRIVPIAELRVGMSALLEGTIQSIDHPAGRRPSLAVQLSDGSGRVTLRFYQVYAGLKDKFVVGHNLRVFGEIRLGARGLELYH